MNFKEWLALEGGLGSGTKVSATGFGAGGQAQAGVGMSKPASLAPSPFSPSDTVPKGFKPTPGAGGKHGIFQASKPGISGAGKYQPIKPITPVGGSIGGGSPGVRK